MTLSTHVLDATTGKPAVGVAVTLTAGGVIATGITDADGRISGLGGDLTTGIYRLQFDTATYFAEHGVTGFYPEVVIAFEITAAGHHHVPLLLSPYSYSTYKGS